MVLREALLVVSNCTTLTVCTTLLALDCDFEAFPRSACVDQVSQLNYFLRIQAMDLTNFCRKKLNIFLYATVMHQFTKKSYRAGL